MVTVRDVQTVPLHVRPGVLESHFLPLVGIFR
jgi:hypothetical protein